MYPSISPCPGAPSFLLNIGKGTLEDICSWICLEIRYKDSIFVTALTRRTPSLFQFSCLNLKMFDRTKWVLRCRNPPYSMQIIKSMRISLAQTGSTEVDRSPAQHPITCQAIISQKKLKIRTKLVNCLRMIMSTMLLALSRFKKLRQKPPVHADAMGAGGSVVEGQIVDGDSENVTRNHWRLHVAEATEPSKCSETSKMVTVKLFCWIGGSWLSQETVECEEPQAWGWEGSMPNLDLMKLLQFLLTKHDEQVTLSHFSHKHSMYPTYPKIIYLIISKISEHALVITHKFTTRLVPLYNLDHIQPEFASQAPRGAGDGAGHSQAAPSSDKPCRDFAKGHCKYNWRKLEGSRLPQFIQFQRSIESLQRHHGWDGLSAWNV